MKSHRNRPPTRGDMLNQCNIAVLALWANSEYIFLKAELFCATSPVPDGRFRHPLHAHDHLFLRVVTYVLPSHSIISPASRSRNLRNCDVADLLRRPYARYKVGSRRFDRSSAGGLNAQGATPRNTPLLIGPQSTFIT